MNRGRMTGVELVLLNEFSTLVVMKGGDLVRLEGEFGGLGDGDCVVGVGGGSVVVVGIVGTGVREDGVTNISH